MSDVTAAVMLGACRSRITLGRNCALAVAGRGCGYFFTAQVEMEHRRLQVVCGLAPARRCRRGGWFTFAGDA